MKTERCSFFVVYSGPWMKPQLKLKFNYCRITGLALIQIFSQLSPHFDAHSTSLTLLLHLQLTNREADESKNNVHPLASPRPQKLAEQPVQPAQLYEEEKEQQFSEDEIIATISQPQIKIYIEPEITPSIINNQQSKCFKQMSTWFNLKKHIYLCIEGFKRSTYYQQKNVIKLFVCNFCFRPSSTFSLKLHYGRVLTTIGLKQHQIPVAPIVQYSHRQHEKAQYDLPLKQQIEKERSDCLIRRNQETGDRVMKQYIDLPFVKLLATERAKQSSLQLHPAEKVSSILHQEVLYKIYYIDDMLVDRSRQCNAITEHAILKQAAIKGLKHIAHLEGTFIGVTHIAFSLQEYEMDGLGLSRTLLKLLWILLTASSLQVNHFASNIRGQWLDKHVKSSNFALRSKFLNMLSQFLH